MTAAKDAAPDGSTGCWPPINAAGTASLSSNAQPDAPLPDPDFAAPPAESRNAITTVQRFAFVTHPDTHHMNEYASPGKAALAR
jgi:hypothetical protein